MKNMADIIMKQCTSPKLLKHSFCGFITFYQVFFLTLLHTAEQTTTQTTSHCPVCQ